MGQSAGSIPSMQSGLLLLQLLAGAGARPQSQTCVGGQCTRSNGGSSPLWGSFPFNSGLPSPPGPGQYRSWPALQPFGHGFPFTGGFNFHSSNRGQNCYGNRCNQGSGFSNGQSNHSTDKRSRKRPSMKRPSMKRPSMKRPSVKRPSSKRPSKRVQNCVRQRCTQNN